MVKVFRRTGILKATFLWTIINWKLEYTMADTKEKLSAQTRFLHWFIAIGMIMLVAVGIYMAETKTFALYPIHKSLGAIMLVFALWRLVVRLKNRFPQPLGKQSAALEVLAKLVPWLLLLTTILLPF